MEIKRIIRDGVENDVYYGEVKMPHYHGIEGSVHEVDEEWAVDGVLDDGRVFEIVVQVDFVFDGCSVPRFLWRLTDHPLSVPRVAAALAHDFLYGAQLTDRKTADLIYENILHQVDYSTVKRWLEYRSLRAFGWSAWNEKTDADRAFARAHGALWLEGEEIKGE